MGEELGSVVVSHRADDGVEGALAWELITARREAMNSLAFTRASDLLFSM